MVPSVFRRHLTTQHIFKESRCDGRRASVVLRDSAFRDSAADVLPDLEGRWRLVYSSGTLPAIRYIPVPEFIAVAGGLRNIALTSDIGPVHTECANNLAVKIPACSCHAGLVAADLC